MLPIVAQTGTEINSWGQLSALGIVGIVLVFIVVKMLPGLHDKFVEQSRIFANAMASSQDHFTEILDKMHSRMDAWEQLRHADQVRLEEVLRDMVVHYAGRERAP